MARMASPRRWWTGCGRCAGRIPASRRPQRRRRRVRRRTGWGTTTSFASYWPRRINRVRPPYSIGSMFLMSTAMVTYRRRTCGTFMRSCRYRHYAAHCISSSSALAAHASPPHLTPCNDMQTHTRTGPPRGPLGRRRFQRSWRTTPHRTHRGRCRRRPRRRLGATRPRGR